MNGFRQTAIALGVGTLAAATLLAQPTSKAQEWQALTDRLERSALRGTSKDVRMIRTDLLRRLTQPEEKPNASLIQYTIAYAGWRMANMPDVASPEQAGLLDDAVTRLQDVVKAEPKHVEAHALLGSTLGVQAGRSPMKAMVLGPRASSAIGRATSIDGSNPRVVMLDGVSAFNTPSMFGGGIDKAERLLRRSLELFAKESADKPWPNWGRFDAHTWLGQALVRKGDKTGARAEYDKALAIAPESGWIRFSLLPALEKAAKP